MKKYRIINRYRFYAVIGLTLIILFASMFMMVVNAKSTSTEVLVPIYVSDGDNLWKLAAKYCDDESDIRSYIHRVISINHLSDVNIKPGDLLMFPQLAQQ